MINLKDLNDHLDSNEKILKFFRPSRRAYIIQYAFHILVLLLAIFFTFYGEPSSNLFIMWKFINLASEIVLIYAVIMLLRLEYRIWSRKYALTSERLLYSKGIFSEEFKSSSYNHVTDIGFQQTFWDKIMNTGTLKVNTAGGDNYEIRYRKVHDPLGIKKIINDSQNMKTSSKKNKQE